MSDVSTIASVASNLSAAKLSDEVGMKVFKKALDSQKEGAEALIAAIPPMPANPNIGRNVNVSA